MQKNLIYPNSHPGYLSGKYYQNTPLGSTDASSNGVLATNSITYSPFQVNKNITIDRLAIYCAGIVVLGTARLGIYSNNNGLPGSLLVDAGELIAATGGAKEAIVSLTLSNDWYWFAGATSVAPNLNCRTAFLGNNHLLGQSAPISSSVSASLRQTGFTYGAFPTNAPVDNLSFVAGNLAPLFWFRVA